MSGAGTLNASPLAPAAAEQAGPALSVVVPHYGDPAPALALLEQLAAQTLPAAEVLVVDDASPQPFPDRLPSGAPEGTVVLRRQANGGFGAAVNTGLRAASARNVLVMNSDLSVAPDLLEHLGRAAEAWGPAVLSPQVLDAEGHPAWVGRYFPGTAQQVVEWLSPLARWRQRPALHRAVGHDTRCTTGTVVPVDWLMGACLLLPRAEALAVGGFDERYFMNCEETDLQLRLRARGIPSVFLGTTTVVHAGGGSSDPARRREWLVVSRYRYAQRWGSPRALRAGLRAASVANFAANRLRQAAGRDVDAAAVLAEELRLAGLQERGSHA